MPQRVQRALVTAGGTREPVDDVRVLTNISRGRFGIAIAKALAANGVETILLCSKDTPIIEIEDRSHITIRHFTTSDSLRSEIEAVATEAPLDILFMAAAVSDYIPVRRAGKMDSSLEEVTITLRRAEKILPTLRALCGIKTFIVGFKLLSNVTTQELLDAAAKQIHASRSNLCVGNQLQDLGADTHAVTLITPEGGHHRVSGNRADVAREVVKFATQRAEVDWFHTEQRNVELLPAAVLEAKLLRFVQETGLLAGTPGNLSLRRGFPDPFRNDHPVDFLITPRQVEKGTLRWDDLLPVSVDRVSRTVYCPCPGGRKPSIDSGVHALLYARYPDVVALLHFHQGNALVLPRVTTQVAFPCGSTAEAREIEESMNREGLQGYGGFSVELIRHGYLLGLTAGALSMMVRDWRNIVEEYRQHLGTLSELPDGLTPFLSPVIHNTSVVGLVNRVSGLGISLYLPKHSRGRGLGKECLDELIRRQENVVVHDQCEVVRFYLSRGFEIVEERGKLSILKPPSITRAATIALVNVNQARVLLGRRLVGDWTDYYAFPGGKLEEDEDPLSGALRELGEEFKIYSELPAPARSLRTIVRSENGRLFDITTFVIPVWQDVTAQATAEMDPLWEHYPRLGELKTAAGTRRVIGFIGGYLGEF